MQSTRQKRAQTGALGIVAMALSARCTGTESAVVPVQVPVPVEVPVDLDLVLVGSSGASGQYAITVGGVAWYESTPAPRVCIKGRTTRLVLTAQHAVHGVDALGQWTGTMLTFRLHAGLGPANAAAAVVAEHTLKKYAALPYAAVITVRYPQTLNTSSCGTVDTVAAEVLALNTSATSELRVLSWGGGLSLRAATGLAGLHTDGIKSGPVVSVGGKHTLVWSTLDSHKVVPQQNAAGVYSLGLSAAFSSITGGFSHSILLAAVNGGPTAAMYAWGALLQGKAVHKVKDITLSHIGYYTDDGVCVCMSVCE